MIHVVCKKVEIQKIATFFTSHGYTLEDVDNVCSYLGEYGILVYQDDYSFYKKEVGSVSLEKLLKDQESISKLVSLYKEADKVSKLLSKKQPIPTKYFHDGTALTIVGAIKKQ